MKQITKNLIKALLVVVFFTGSSIVLSTSGVKSVNEVKATEATYAQVYDYLVGNGYSVVTLGHKAFTEYDWISHTVKAGRNYSTTVYCDENGIVGHGDIPM